MRRAKLSRGKGRARMSHGAGAAAQVMNACEDFRLRGVRGLPEQRERGDLSSNEFGEHQVKLRGNRRGVALPELILTCVQRKGITIL